MMWIQIVSIRTLLCSRCCCKCCICVCIFKYMYPNIEHFSCIMAYILGVIYGFSFFIFIFFHYPEPCILPHKSGLGIILLHLRLGSAVKIRTQRHIWITCPFSQGQQTCSWEQPLACGRVEALYQQSPDSQPGVVLNWITQRCANPIPEEERTMRCLSSPERKNRKCFYISLYLCCFCAHVIMHCRQGKIKMSISVLSPYTSIP